MIFLVFSPLAAFAGAVLIAPVAIALFVAAGLATVLLLVDLVRRRSLKIWQMGSAGLFLALGLYVLAIDRDLPANAVRVVVDGGMLLIALASLLLRFPFTIQYARETVDAEIAARPMFARANYVLTGVWAVAFLAMLLGDLGTLLVPWLPFWAGLAAVFVARNAAGLFTRWYVARRHAQGAALMLAAQVQRG